MTYKQGAKLHFHRTKLDTLEIKPTKLQILSYVGLFIAAYTLLYSLIQIV